MQNFDGNWEFDKREYYLSNFSYYLAEKNWKRHNYYESNKIPRGCKCVWYFNTIS